MFKNLMIAGATTVAIAAGALGATAAPAAAAGVTVHIGDNDGGRWDHRDHRGRRMCRPVFKNVKVWRHGHPVWKQVKVGERCAWRRW